MLFLQFRDLKQSHYSMNDNDQLYGQFLAFAKEHRKAAITKALEIKPDDEPNETVILLKTLNMFAEQNGPETFFLDDCILVHLPLSEQLQLFEKWCDDDYFFCWGPMMFDAMKMAHRLWPQFAKYDWRNPPTTYPMRELYRCFEGAFERLRKLHPKNAGNNQQHGRKHERYPCFTLMGLLPLMDKDDEGVQIFEHAAALPYSDAQEGIERCCTRASKFNSRRPYFCCGSF